MLVFSIRAKCRLTDILWKIFWIVSNRSISKNLTIHSPRRLIGLDCFEASENIRILGGARIEIYKLIKKDPRLIIGANVSINYDLHIACANRIEIGEGSLLASRVFITDHYHGDPKERYSGNSYSSLQLYSPGPVIIGKNVWIGEAVSIMPNITIGDGCIIGANSVVTKSFPAGTKLAGNPAKPIQ